MISSNVPSSAYQYPRSLLTADKPSTVLPSNLAPQTQASNSSYPDLSVVVAQQSTNAQSAAPSTATSSQLAASKLEVDASVSQTQERQQDLEQAREKQRLLEDQRKISQLSARDREVRAHEQAHAAVGGTYAGAPRFQTERGPDGVNYAVGGEVSIDVGKAATPQETIIKAQIVRRAALAPAEPSPQDRRVAAQASQMESQARTELRMQNAEAAEAESAAASESSRDQVPVTNRSVANSEIANSEIANSEVTPPRGQSLSGQAPSELGNGSGFQSPLTQISNRAQQFVAIANADQPRPGSRLDQVA